MRLPSGGTGRPSLRPMGSRPSCSGTRRPARAERCPPDATSTSFAWVSQPTARRWPRPVTTRRSGCGISRRRRIQPYRSDSAPTLRRQDRCANDRPTRKGPEALREEGPGPGDPAGAVRHGDRAQRITFYYPLLSAARQPLGADDCSQRPVSVSRPSTPHDRSAIGRHSVASCAGPDHAAGAGKDAYSTHQSAGK